MVGELHQACLSERVKIVDGGKTLRKALHLKETHSDGGWDFGKGGGGSGGGGNANELQGKIGGQYT